MKFLRHDGTWPARKEQDEGLTLLEKTWNNADIHAIQAGPGSGKSWLAIVMQKTLKNKRVAILTPHNQLVDQYKKDYPNLNVLIGKTHYNCEDPEFNTRKTLKMNCGEIKEKCRSYCNDCKYKKAKNRSYTRDTIYNVYSYIMACVDYPNTEVIPELQADIVILDEAEKCIDMLMEQCTVTVNLNNFPIEENQISDREYIYEYLRDVAQDYKNLAEIEDDFRIRAKYIKKAERLFFMAVIIKKDFEMYSVGIVKKKRNRLLELKPMTLPKSVANKILGKEKTIMMSATIFKQDLEVYSKQGLDVNELTFGTCIPPKNRMLLNLRNAYNGRKAKNVPVPELAQILLNIVKYAKKKNVLIHTTYSKMERLADEMHNINPYLRLHTHNSENKQTIIEQWKEEGGILLGAGVDTGLDLKDNLCRVNIIYNIRWPSLGDHWVEKRKSWANGQRWYTLEALKYVIQAAGRGVRHENDWCLTLCLDPNLKMIVQMLQNRYNINVPSTFLDATNFFADRTDVDQYLNEFSR